MKLARLFEHQLELSRDHFPQVERRAAVVKGRIFQPAEQALPEKPLASLAEKHLRGSWVRVSHLHQELVSDTAVRYLVLKKPYWLADARAAQDAASMTGNQLEQFARSRSRPFLVSQLMWEEGTWLEQTRWFIVPDSWPWG